MFSDSASNQLIMEIVNIDQINNNLLEKKVDCSNLNHEKKVKSNPKRKYTRSELKSLIKSPVKAGTKNVLLPCSDSDCEEVFWSKWSLQKHVKQRHAEITFPCKTCGKTFIYETNLEDHVKDNHKPKPKTRMPKVKLTPNMKQNVKPGPKQNLSRSKEGFIKHKQGNGKQ